MKQPKQAVAIFLKSLLTLAILLTAGKTFAQQKPLPGVDAGNYIFSGGLTAGYRTATIQNTDGVADTFATNRYNESYNLQKGVLLNSLNLFGEKKGSEGFFDELYVNASGINDPITTASVRMRAFNSYDLKVDFRNAKYFLSRNDSILSGLHKFDFTRTMMNASLDVDATDELKINVSYNSTGRDGGAVLTHVGQAVDGAYSPPGVGSMIYWINVPRTDKTSDFSAAINWQLAKSTSLRLGGGMRSFTQQLTGTMVDSTSLSYTNLGKGVYTYDPATYVAQINTFSGMRGAYIAPNTAKGASVSTANWLPMRSYSYDEKRDNTTPYFYFEGVSHPADELDLTANLRYESTDFNPTISLTQGGLGGGLTKQKDGSYLPTDSAYLFKLASTAMNLKRSVMTGNLNMTGRFNDQLSLTGRLGYTQTKEDGAATWKYNMTSGSKVYPDSLLSTTTSYNIPEMDVEGFLSYAPIDMLALKGGVRFTSKSPTVNYSPGADADDEINASLSQKNTSMTPYINFNLRPANNFRIDGRFSTTKTTATEDGNEVDMNVRVTPKSQTAYSLGVMGDPISQLHVGLRYTAKIGSSTLAAFHFDSGANGNEIRRTMSVDARPYNNKTSGVSASVGFTFSKEIAVNVSGEYRTNTYDIPVTWGTINQYATSRTDVAFYGDLGTMPITQNTIDRNLDVTLRVAPLDALHLDAGVTLNSSSGGTKAYKNVISAYDPVTNPKGIVPDLTRYGGPYSSYSAHAEAAFDITANIGVMVDYTIDYYKEDKVDDYVALNNFKTSLLRGGFSLKF